MATIMQETHDALRSIVQKMTTIAVDLLQIINRQQDLIYKMEVIAAVLHEMPMLHPDLQRIVDEQHPISMDGLPALHLNLQWIIDEQQLMSMDVLPVLHLILQQIIDDQ
jgi:hypothetical protein